MPPLGAERDSTSRPGGQWRFALADPAWIVRQGGGLRPSTAGPMLDPIDLSGLHGGVNTATELLWGLRRDDLDCWRGPRAGHPDTQSGGIRRDFTRGARLYGCKIEIKAFAR